MTNYSAGIRAGEGIKKRGHKNAAHLFIKGPQGSRHVHNPLSPGRRLFWMKRNTVRKRGENQRARWETGGLPPLQRAHKKEASVPQGHEGV